MATPVTRSAHHSIHSATLADVLERVLDKGLVIAGDVKVKLLDIELLTIQIRLVIASVDKAREMGLDWWSTSPEYFGNRLERREDDELRLLKDRINSLESRLSTEVEVALPD
jgi:Gas vesicle protein